MARVASSVFHTHKRKLIGLFVFLAMYIIYSYKCINHQSKWYSQGSKGFGLSCNESRRRMERLMVLSDAVQDVLNAHDLPTYLLYGSIWGPLRGYNGPLPWDYDVDLGADYSDVNMKKMNSIAAELKKRNIESANHYNQSGLFKYWLNGEEAILDLYVFKCSWFGWTRRVGWEVFLLHVHYLYKHRFPCRLTQNVRTLPTVLFGNRQIHIPVHGKEIMRYLFPQTWQIEIKPKDFNCDTKRRKSKLSSSQIERLKLRP